MLRSAGSCCLHSWRADSMFPAPVEAAEPKVIDRAEFFSKSAVEQATRKLQEINRRFKVEVVIETFPSIPENMQAKYKPERRSVLSPLGRDARGRRRHERHLCADLQESGTPADRARSSRSAERPLRSTSAMCWSASADSLWAEAIRRGPCGNRQHHRVDAGSQSWPAHWPGRAARATHSRNVGSGQAAGAIVGRCWAGSVSGWSRSWSSG